MTLSRHNTVPTTSTFVVMKLEVIAVLVYPLTLETGHIIFTHNFI